jgi:cytoplasmic iron level regulating protein YaaA (DUF328/UPF0246 family)
MILLLHSSKTMRSPSHDGVLRRPELLGKAEELAGYLKTLPMGELGKAMHISGALAEKTQQTIADWSAAPGRQSVAMDSFVGYIFSGLQAGSLSEAERDYADKHLRILSGLYGILRPYDGICPYRLEMGYRLPDSRYKNLYQFWGEAVAKTLPESGLIVNLAAVEYSKVVTPYVEPDRLVAPRFLTLDPKTGEPAFVVVHAKIARGAFANWLIRSRVATTDRLSEFAEIGYRYDEGLSTPTEPAFVCEQFGGLGLSVRLEK